MSSRAGSPEQQQQQQQQGLTPEEFHELQLAASAADKHPVTWRSMKEKVWCEVGGVLVSAAVKAILNDLLISLQGLKLWLNWRHFAPTTACRTCTAAALGMMCEPV
jgi:hypothetical protein